MLKEPQVYARIATSPYLPKFPEGISRIFALLREPDVDIDALADAIEQDGALSDLVLHNLNAKGFAFRQMDSIREAIVYLGIVSARNIVIFFITHMFFPEERAKHTQLFTQYRYWEHVLATAIAGEAIARRTGYEDPFQLFTYGLLHDLGILVLDACLPDEEQLVLERMRAGTPHLEAERAVLGATHADAGAWLCAREGFPQDINCAVKYHHDPAAAADCHETVRMLYVANCLGTRLIAPRMPVPLDDSCDDAVRRALGLSPAELDEIYAALSDRVASFTPQPIGF